MNERKLDLNSQRALDLFNQAKAQREQQRADPNTPAIDVAPMRARLSQDVDLNKADARCKRCYGTGIIGYQMAGPDRIPIVCRCVVRSGGVREDKLQQILAGQHPNGAVLAHHVPRDKRKRAKRRPS